MKLGISLLRILHIAAGMVALGSFWIPLWVRKGNNLHKQAGWVYVYAMYVAAATAALIVPLRLLALPREKSLFPLFLAHIALLSFTAARYGVRVLQQKQRREPMPLGPDVALPALLLGSSVAIAAYGYSQGFLLPLYFAPAGVLTALPQLRVLRGVPEGKVWWLLEHIGAMVIACIATTTAFLVNNAGRLFGEVRSPLVWLAPTLLGIPFSVYWKRKYDRPRAAGLGPRTGSG